MVHVVWPLWGRIQPNTSPWPLCFVSLRLGRYVICLRPQHWKHGGAARVWTWTFWLHFMTWHTHVCCISKITDKRNHVLSEGFMCLSGRESSSSCYVSSCDVTFLLGLSGHGNMEGSVQLSWDSGPGASSPRQVSSSRPHSEVSEASLSLFACLPQLLLPFRYGVAVQDFAGSWRSGLAFLAVIKAIDPSLVDMKQALEDSMRENLEKAFSIAHDALHIPRLLEPEGSGGSLSFSFFIICF